MTCKRSLAWMKYTFQFQPPAWAQCKYWRYQRKTDHRKHVLVGSGTPLSWVMLTPFYGFTHMSLYSGGIPYTLCSTPTTPYWPGWDQGPTKYSLNGRLRWIIVCEWKLGQIISVLLAQGWVRPLSPTKHALCVHSFVLPSLFPLHTYLLTLWLFYNNFLSVLVSLHLSLPFFLNNFSFPLLLRFFPNNPGLYPGGHSPLCGCHWQCLQ